MSVFRSGWCYLQPRNYFACYTGQPELIGGSKVGRIILNIFFHGKF